jgi:uncharacterized membrane protein YedE/YeeE
VASSTKADFLYHFYAPSILSYLKVYSKKTKEDIMLFYILVTVVSFIVGFAMKRGGLCTYAAVTQIVNEKRMERMMVFLGVATWAGVVVLPLHWLYPNLFSLSLGHDELLLAVIAGAILGVGAYFNKGCFFGTFVALVGGNLNYIFTIIGLVVGVVLAYFYIPTEMPMVSKPSVVKGAGIVGYLWLVFMILFALFMTLSIKLPSDSFFKRVLGLERLSKGSVFAMIAIGVGGGVLYATVNGWNYSDVLANTTAYLIGAKGMGATTLAILSTLFMVVGGIVAAIYAKEFTLKKIELYMLIGCFAGGVLMGASSMYIPGGNDGLLLKGILAFVPHAFTGYASMLMAMLLLVYFFRNEHKA